jgi:molybdopterin-binding protein
LSPPDSTAQCRDPTRASPEKNRSLKTFYNQIIIVSHEEARMKISARNQLKGKVIKVTPGAVNSEIAIELPGGQQVVSIITKASADSLGLKVGKEAYAVVKASSVMIAVD